MSNLADNTFSQNSETVPSLIKWTGSKRSQAKEIANIIPSHKRYIEPFLGGGALLYFMAHPGAVANDIYKPLTELWKLVRDDPQSLICTYNEQWGKLNQELDEINVSTMTRGNKKPKVFYDIRAKFNSCPNAFDLNFLMRTCVNGIVRFNEKGEFNNSFHLSRRGMQPKRFEAAVSNWHSKLQGVVVSNRDYRDILADTTEGDFVYLDPPYAGTKNRYASLLEPEELFEELEKLNLKKVKWALSYDGKRGDKDLTHNLPKEIYKRMSYLHSGNSAVKKVLKGPIESVYESLYLNY